MTGAKRYLRIVLLLQGVLYLFIGSGWVWAHSLGRLRGIAWMERAVEAVSPWLNVDQAIGVLFLLAGVLMVASGSKLANRFRWMDNAGFLVALCVPLLVAFVFIAGFLLGTTPNGYVSALHYFMYTTPYFAYVLLRPQDISVHTGSIKVKGESAS